MGTENRKIACHHIKLQEGCQWCDVYKHQEVRQCDRCKNNIQTDMIYLSTKYNQPELICMYCNHTEQKGN